MRFGVPVPGGVQLRLYRQCLGSHTDYPVEHSAAGTPFLLPESIFLTDRFLFILSLTIFFLRFLFTSLFALYFFQRLHIRADDLVNLGHRGNPTYRISDDLLDIFVIEGGISFMAGLEVKYLS